MKGVELERQTTYRTLPCSEDTLADIRAYVVHERNELGCAAWACYILALKVIGSNHG